MAVWKESDFVPVEANYNCILIDLDGTLLDFAQAEREAIRETMAAFHLPQDEDTCALFSQINAELWERLEKGELKREKLLTMRFEKLLQQMGAKGNAVQMGNDYLSRFAQQADPLPGASELLEELAEFATLAVASNGSWKVQKSRLEKSGLAPYFDDVFISEKLGVAKPSPRFFDMALQRLGIQNKQRVLMVGDSLLADIKGGQAAGLATCWCNFDEREASEAIRPTYTVQDYTQLKLAAIGKEALEDAAMREKRHMV